MRAAVGVLAAATPVVVGVEFIAVALLPAMARDLGVSLADAGRLVSAFAVAAALLGPPLTIAASRLEPRRVLVATLAVFGAGNLLAAAVATYPVVLAVRIVEGAALPVFLGVGSAAVTAAGHGRVMAQLNAGVVVGVVIAIPAGVALAASAAWTAAFATLGALSLAMAAALGLGFRVPAAPAGSLGAQAALLAAPAFLAHLVLSAAVFTAMFASYTYLAAFLEATADLRGGTLALALATFGAAGLAGNHVAGRLVGRGPLTASAGAVAVLGAITAAATLARHDDALRLPLLLGWGAAHASGFVLCQVRVMHAGSAAPAFAASLNIAACNVGIALGAALGGSVVERGGAGVIGLATTAVAVMALGIALATRRLER